MEQSGPVQAGDASTSNVPLGPTLILSGGTGYNDLVSATLPSPTTYVLPISDNGGSSSEIIRCFGGPSIGDIRSRLVRLIPSEVTSNGDATGTGGNEALRNLLSYRFPVDNSEDEILDEWKEVIAGTHHIWEGVDEVRGSIVRGFITHFHKAVLATFSKPFPSSDPLCSSAAEPFDLHGLSIGNAFLSSCARTFDSLQAAIWLFCNVARIDTKQVRAIPCVETTETSHIAARLENGQLLLGQCEISHPAKKREGDATPAVLEPKKATNGLLTAVESLSLSDPITKMLRPVISRTNSNLVFSKAAGKNALPSRIQSIHYAFPSIDAAEGQLRPQALSANPAYLAALQKTETLIYSCGSLYTSIVPLLVLQGVGVAIAHSKTIRRKVLLLNTQLDRETGGYDALDFIRAITHACSSSSPTDHEDCAEVQPRQLMSHLVYHPKGQVAVDVEQVEELGISCVRIPDRPGKVAFTEEDVRYALHVIMKAQSEG
ncbi:hypothetical protein BCV69DRAFT_310947 [Microstroma glucosiphilum]|uniref:Uncharacterized protein n=1 Tax=Pseudomicrostroma glucosiphilum TaxID=1684307 RepID=A0A316UB79_9BASI|nr:hypothetical protein BCV69DRAFT_310947 [Pseudomicrostroma glucosiphilum]PWN22118.1 hypothetical protein BCV69DRAFT_310947 [Pseudomicrostroma glucosiphilum]